MSAHFLVRRDGELVQFVPVHERAWHAGASRWRGRERCNDFSIGIELEGTDDGAVRSRAVRSASRALVRALRAALPLRDIAAHSDVAPGRKTDPGAHFDWARLLADLARASLASDSRRPLLDRGRTAVSCMLCRDCARTDAPISNVAVRPTPIQHLVTARACEKICSCVRCNYIL